MVLKDGRVDATGAPDDLLATNAEMQKIWRHAEATWAESPSDAQGAQSFQAAVVWQPLPWYGGPNYEPSRLAT